MSVPESRQGTRADNVATDERQATKADYTELPPPKEPPQKSALKNKESVTQGQQDYNNLADGMFDEAQSHQSFLEALNAWRGVKPSEDDKQTKQVRFEGQAKKNFFAAIDTNEADWNVNCLP